MLNDTTAVLFDKAYILLVPDTSTLSCTTNIPEPHALLTARTVAPMAENPESYNPSSITAHI